MIRKRPVILILLKSRETRLKTKELKCKGRRHKIKEKNIKVMRTNNKASNNGKTNQILRKIRTKSLKSKMRTSNNSNKRKEEKLRLIKSWSRL